MSQYTLSLQEITCPPFRLLRIWSRTSGLRRYHAHESACKLIGLCPRKLEDCCLEKILGSGEKDAGDCSFWQEFRCDTSQPSLRILQSIPACRPTRHVCDWLES